MSAKPTIISLLRSLLTSSGSSKETEGLNPDPNAQKGFYILGLRQDAAGAAMPNGTFSRLIIDSLGDLKVVDQNSANTYNEIASMSSIVYNNIFKRVSSEFTRPNDTNVYASGDVVSDSTSATTHLRFQNICKDQSKSGCILSAQLIDEANQATKGDFDLMLFNGNSAPTVPADNVQLNISHADFENCIGVIQFSGGAARIGNVGSGATGSLFYPSPLQNAIPFTSNTSNEVWGILVARNAYTPVALEKFKVILGLEQK